jgi:hypothetical protein
LRLRLGYLLRLRQQQRRKRRQTDRPHQINWRMALFLPAILVSHKLSLGVLGCITLIMKFFPSSLRYINSFCPQNLFLFFFDFVIFTRF